MTVHLREILVVDDEVGIRELLSEILQDEGYRVSLAENATAARAFRARQQPSLVLLDIWMPDTDGVTLLREWAAAADAHGYLLQIAPTPEFDNGVLERRLPALLRHTETLPDGEWHWRLASLDEAGRTHLWSAHRAFRVQPLPGAPAAFIAARIAA